ncbi:MAG TPA: amidase [Streptosporangiaceae bacterium]|jgi:amidase|nr:amidase [Streptosporangiaceae bacterium]
MPAPVPVPGPELATAQVPELQQAMAAGTLTSAGLTAFCLDRIAQLNPVLHAVITVSPDAAAQAAASDEARAAGSARGPLDGIPVLIKDNIAVRGMPATAGSPALAGAKSGDAFLVARLRAAGAVIVGKANLSEWANFRSSHSTSGWSALGGQTANPHDLARNPSGSSSGSGAAVAAGLVPLAVGTETDGSIVCPASACGVVGIKPTLGLISRAGIVPISAAQDTAGPMARTIADAAALLAAVAGADPADPATTVDLAPGFAASLSRAALDPAAVRGARVGVWREGSRLAGAETVAVLDGAVAALRELGAEVTDPVDLPGADQIGEPETEALLHEFKHDLDAYLARLPGSHPRSLAELIDFNTHNASTVLTHFGQETFEQAAACSGDPADPAAMAARAEATKRAKEALDGPLAAHRLDAIVALTANPAWLTDHVLGDHTVFYTSGPCAVAGYPAVCVMAGEVRGLPVGLSFMGPAWSEPTLIALAAAFERGRRLTAGMPAGLPASA